MIVHTLLGWLSTAIRERDEARAEVERMRAENDEKQAPINAARAHRNSLRAEIEWLLGKCDPTLEAKP